MTVGKKFKKKVRARMAETGETYVQAKTALEREQQPWRIEIIEYATDKPIRVLRYSSERLAERAERGVERQLNHEEFFTLILGPGEVRAT